MALKFIFLIAAVNCVYLAAGVPQKIDESKSMTIKLLEDHESKVREFGLTLQSKFKEIIEKRTKQIDSERHIHEHSTIHNAEYMKRIYEDTLAEGKKKNIDATECIANNKKKWKDYEMDVEECLKSAIGEGEFNRTILIIHNLEDHIIADKSKVNKCGSHKCLSLVKSEEQLRFYNAKRAYEEGEELVGQIDIEFTCLIPSEEWQIFIDESQNLMAFMAKCTEEKEAPEKEPVSQAGDAPTEEHKTTILSDDATSIEEQKTTAMPVDKPTTKGQETTSMPVKETPVEEQKTTVSPVKEIPVEEQKTTVSPVEETTAEEQKTTVLPVEETTAQEQVTTSNGDEEFY